MKRFFIGMMTLLMPLLASAVTHEYVDLGLPSGTLWATCNIGASAPEEYGNYYAWGETATKTTYSWSNYAYCSGTSSTAYDIGEYIPESEDSKVTNIQGSKYDVAKAVWGSDWAMPTWEQVHEIIEYCNVAKRTINGISGIRVVGPNGKSIFFPYTGYKYDSNYSGSEDGYFWSATSDYYSLEKHKAIVIYAKGSGLFTSKSIQRRTGVPVRAVRSSNEPVIEPTPEIKPEAIDLGLSVKWATFNVGATSCEQTGNYYAWGETTTKSKYTWATYTHCAGTSTTCQDIGSDISGNATYDAATKEWGSDWRMPIGSEIAELYQKCTWTETTQNGVKGYTVKGPSGKTIFLPFGGCSYEGKDYGVGTYCYYWSGNINPENNQKATALSTISATSTTETLLKRRTGVCIRPVMGEKNASTEPENQEPENQDPENQEPENQEPENQDPENQENELVDLGLSVKWASFNVEATASEKTGGFYAWGETDTKSKYSWATYSLCDGSSATCKNIGSNIRFSTTYDVAYINDNAMALPTVEQWNELITKCTWTETTQNGVKGYTVKGPSGNTIFLPFGGCSYDGKNYGSGTYAYYWTANNVSSDNAKAQAAYIKTGATTTISSLNRRTGVAVRPVELSQIVEPQPTIKNRQPESINLGLSVEWNNYNLGGSPYEYDVDYFAWGETATKASYTWGNYVHGSGTSSSVKNIGSNISATDYDAAHATDWGNFATSGRTNDWRLPTVEEMNELLSKCTFKETNENQVKGFTVTGPNGNSIFIPFFGCSYDGNNYGEGNYAYIWTADIDPTDNKKANAILIKEGAAPTLVTIKRRTGAAIWPVRGQKEVKTSEPYALLSTDGKTLTFYCDNSQTSRTGTKYSLNKGANLPEWNTAANRKTITKVVFDSSFANARPTTCFAWFAEMETLATITNLSYLNTEEVTNMTYMFGGCTKLTDIDLSHFNTQKVTTMDHMFTMCTTVKTLDLKSFDTSNVTKMSGMFLWNSATTINVSNFNTQKVTDMSGMFAFCYNLSTINVSNFNTEKVTTMESMFMSSALTSLDLSSFTLRSGINTDNMLTLGKLEKLTVPATANYLNEKACSSVGNTSKPCLLVFPEGFTPNKTISENNYYVWKGGYFYDNVFEEEEEDKGDALDYEYVNLGIVPSDGRVGELWATCNWGAKQPEESGNYYAWGETSTKTSYTWDNYEYEENGQIKVVSGEINTNTMEGWASMPTTTQIRDLFKQTTHKEETLNGVKGIRFTSNTNGKSIFIPYAGCYYDSKTPASGTTSYYWILEEYDSKKAYALRLEGGQGYMDQCQKRTGMPIRHVCNIEWIDEEANFYNFTIDGVRSIHQQTFEEDVIYTLQGARVEPPLQPGVYVKNGKKFVVK